MTSSRLLRWAALIMPIWALVEFLDAFHVPVPHPIVAMVIGAILALTGKLPGPMPTPVLVGTQALFGVMIGSYCELALMRKIGFTMVPLVLVAMVTLVLSGGIGYVFARVTKVDMATATLGFVAGASAAVVASADEFDADSRTVAFMQYLRVAVVAATAPVLVALLSSTDHRMQTHVAAHLLSRWALVARGDIVAGLSITIVLCIGGVWFGRRVNMPNAAMMGPLLLSAALALSGVTHGYAPVAMFKELLYVMVGLEVGTRFTRAVVGQMIRLLPAMTVAVVAMAGVVAVIAVFVATATGTDIIDIYLATTPGSPSAVVGVAESTGANVTMVASAQTIRLFMTVLSLPLLMKLLRSYTERKRAEQEKSSPTDSAVPVPV